MKILLIEDNPDDVALLSDLLAEARSFRFELLTFSRLRQALTGLMEGKCEADVILLDLGLPDSQGFETFRRVHQQCPRVPIVVLSGMDDEALAIKAVREGAQDYLVKGRANGDLLSCSLRYAIERKRAEVALQTSEQKLKFLTAQLMNAQEKERKRIAMELHDELGPSLAVLKMQIRGIQKQLGADQKNIKEECEQVRSYLNEVIDNVRRLCHDLSPTVLEHMGLIQGLGHLIDGFANQFRITRAFELDAENLPLTLEDQIMIYRIFQESLNNIAKHARATEVLMTLKEESGTIRLEVQDNGAGFDAPKVLSRHRGLGLAALDERARMLGGTVKIQSQPGKGTCIACTIPLRPDKPRHPAL